MIRVLTLIAALLLPGPAWPQADEPAPPQPDETITSDTVNYCTALAAQLATQDMPPEARALLTEGRAMCERGLVMGGLRRIRLAIVMVHTRSQN